MFINITQGLYKTKDGYRYDFSAISADVLGGIYEQYLGYVLKKVRKKSAAEAKRAKRKSQGIFYTPKYIVDFIVTQTLGEVLRKTKRKDIPKIKVLDPARGSGSFLIAAYDKILETLEKQNPQISLFTKFDILKDNIYGVDLDEQAVEIAQLNLLLKVLTQRAKLPTLQHNIRMGNSLVSGNAESLEPYFGEKWQEQKPFNWDEEFKEVFLPNKVSTKADEQGGFDVVIGNPPYISYYSKQASYIEPSLMKYFVENYDFLKNSKGKPRLGTVMLFLEKGYKLLKKGGYLGFITDLNIFEYPSVQIRKFLSQRMNIKKIVYRLSDFYGVGSGQCIIIMQKTNVRSKVKFYSGLDDRLPKDGDQKTWLKDENCIWEPLNPNKNILEKIEKNSVTLDSICKVITGVAVNATRKGKKMFIKDFPTEKSFPLLEGSKGVSKSYYPITPTSHLIYDKKLEKKLNDQFDYKYFREKGSHQRPFNIRDIKEFDRPKIFLRQSDVKFTATYSKDLVFGNYSLFTLFNQENNEMLLKYVLALLNSRVLTFYGLQKNIILVKKGKTPQIRSGQRGPKGLRQLPIANSTEKKQEVVAKLVNIMLDLQKELQATSENTDKWNQLKEKIERLDKKIDNEIYKLYGLTNEEIKTIEG